MKVVGFSGPPHCGKDSIAKEIDRTYWDLADAESPQVVIMSLAWYMREMGMTLLGHDPDDDSLYAELKEERQELLERTPEFLTPGTRYERDTLRQFMIELSERFIKPRYGQDFWARRLYQDLMEEGFDDDTIFLVPDFGFQVEPQFFMEKLGPENVLIVQVAREGCDFSKDSRSYVGADHNLALENNATLGWAAQQVVAKMTNMGWL